MNPLTPPLPGEAQLVPAGPHSLPAIGRGGVSATAPSPDTLGPTTGGEPLREELRALLTTALEQLDLTSEHGLPVLAEGVALRLCQSAGLPRKTALRWPELEAVCPR